VDERLDRQREQTIESLSEAVATERELLITTTFDRFAEERSAFLDDLETRSETLQGILVELQGAITVSTELATSLQGTVEAVDRVVSRFDPEERRSEPLDIEQLQKAAIAAGEAAERITVTLERADALLQRADTATPGSEVTSLVDGVVDRAFWRALILVVVLIVGLALLRLVPRKGSARREPPTPGPDAGDPPSDRG
jgi:hypothetical protein